VNRAGWRTKPRLKTREPELWNSSGVLEVLHNPRYAGLAAMNGQVLGVGHWPPYVTVRQYERIQKLIAERVRKRRKQPREAYLLSRLATCGRCGSPMHGHAGHLREDGSRSRRYICRSHWRDRHPARCDAPPIDADILEAMLATVLRHARDDSDDDGPQPENTESFMGPWTEAPERQQLREAAITGDDASLDLAIERMVVRFAPDLAIHRHVAATRRQTRERSLQSRLRHWADPDRVLVSDERRRETRELNEQLREEFTEIRAHNTVTETVIAVQPRPAPTEGRFPPPVEIRINRHAWARASTGAGRAERRPAAWSDEEIVAALQEWAARHGRAPNSSEWVRGGHGRPGSLCVRRRFRSWERALRRAGLTPNQRRQFRYWTDSEIVDALKKWATRNGRPPDAADWQAASASHPCARSVAQHFGTFKAGVVAADLLPSGS
jgi:hypothetical protein